jgi:hypothetical protein
MTKKEQQQQHKKHSTNGSCHSNTKYVIKHLLAVIVGGTLVDWLEFPNQYYRHHHHRDRVSFCSTSGWTSGIIFAVKNGRSGI